MGHSNSKYKNVEYNISKAKKLVRKCLSEDLYYNHYLNSIMKLDKHYFTELFQGNTDITYPIYGYDFTQLVDKFQDYSKIMYNFHMDESKYDEISLLWKKDVSIINLYDLSEKDFEKKLDAIGLSKSFIYDLKNLLQNTIEAKSPKILEYIFSKCKNLYNLISFTSSKEEKLNIEIKNNNENGGIYKDNLSNVLKGLILLSFPLIKKCSADEILDPLSKTQINNDKVSTNFIKSILKHFEAKKSKTFVHQKLLDLIKDFKYGKNIEQFLSYAKNFYASKLVCFTHVAFGLFNLIENIESFKECTDKLKKTKLNFSREFSKIFSDFEKHKNEIGILDLSNTPESYTKIKEIQGKIEEDKNKLKELIKRLKKEIEEEKDRRGGKGVGIAINCLGLIGGIVGAVLTGGVLAGVYLGAAALNGAAIGIGSAEVHEINKYLDEYEEMLNCGMKKEKEMNEFLDFLKNKYLI